MPHLTLHFLGTYQVTINGRIIDRFRSANVQALLLYLALQPDRPLNRDLLATLLWPEEAETAARTNFRQTLYQLRKLLPKEVLHVTRQIVTFKGESDFSCDVAQFEQALERGELATAAALFKGELAAGLTTDSSNFEEWLRQERAHLHQKALEALERLTDQQLSQGDFSAAIESARQQLSLEPWLESAHRQMMRALALSGDRNGAVAQFEVCRGILEEELGVEPAAETVALLERIQNEALTEINPDLIAGRYGLDEQIGRGAMGVVYRGRDVETGETVAIKMLDPQVMADQPELIERFRREGEALQQLNHPNIVQRLAAAEKDGRHYLVIEYVSGGDLDQLLLKQGALPQKQALTIALDLADALTRAHRLEILHRDLKPANVLLDENRLPRLSDFGIARLGKQADMTAAGSVLGTVAYLSPEACMGEPLDERSDIWSFGVVLYEMLSGQRPFKADTAVGTISHILHNPLPDIRELLPDIPDALEDLLYRMLAKNRADRIPSIRLVGAEIEALLREEPLTPTSAALADKTEIFRDSFATPTPERRHRAKHNLPAPTTPFVGRESELAELERLLAADQQRLVTILGPGGMGKTRLSIEVARRIANGTSSSQITFPDGIFFVELAAVESVEQMFPAIATALNFAISKDIKPQQQIINFFSNKQALLLLDNFEHLMIQPHDGSKVVAAFLQALPNLQILVTSRQKLNLHGETIFHIEGLTFPDWQSTADALSYGAVQLFVQSAKRTMIDFELDDASLPHVAELCRLTEGMPLGILLAAAWVDMLSLSEIVAEMQADLDFLESEMGNLPPRQRSMRAVFDYSWAMLNEREQTVLAKLSVFQGGFTREAAQTVAGASLRQLLGLVNKSLVQRNTETGRFALHELLRQLAAEKLAQAGNRTQVRTDHSHYFFQRLQNFAPTRMRLNLINMAPDTQNLKAAWLWGAKQHNIEQLRPIVEPLHIYFNLVGREFELLTLWLEALRLLPEGDPTLEDVTSSVTALRAAILNRLQETGYEKDHKDRPIDIDALYHHFHASGAKLDQAIACAHLSHRAMRQGDFQQAMHYFQIQPGLFEKAKAPWRLATNLAVAATIMYRVGQVEAGLAMAQRSLALAEEFNDELNKSAALIALGFYTLNEEADYETAARQFSEVAQIGRTLWEQGLTASIVMIGLAWQGFVALLQGDLSETSRLAQEMKRISDVRNNPRDKNTAASFLAMLEAVRGNYKVIDPSIMESVTIGHTGFARYNLILNGCGLRNMRVVVPALISELSQPMTMRWPTVFLYVLPATAFVLAENGKAERATALMAMGWAHPACPRGWWEVMALVQKLEARLQAELSPEEYAAAQAQGREMDVRTTAGELLEELKVMAASHG